MVGFFRSPLFLCALFVLALFVAIPSIAEAASPSSSRIFAATGSEQVEASGTSVFYLPASAPNLYTEWVALLESRDKNRDDRDDNSDTAATYHFDIHSHQIAQLRAPCAGGNDHRQPRAADRILPISGAFLKILARPPPVL